MAVVTLPTGFENLPQGLGQLGSAVAQIAFAGKIRDRETQELIKQRPEVGQSMAKAVRRSGAGALAAVGISPQMEQMIVEMFPEGAAEAIERNAMADPNFIPNNVRAAVAGPGAQASQAELITATAESQLQAGLPQAQTAAALGRAGLEVASTQALRENNIPLLRALAESGQLSISVQTSAAELENLLPQKRVWAEMLGIDVKTTQGQFAMEQIGEYREFIKSVSPHMRGIAAAAGMNPGLAQHILAHEQMDFQRDLDGIRAAAQTGDPQLTVIEQFKLARDLRGEVTNAVDRARTANEEGKTADRDAALADLENLAQWQRSLVQSGILPPTNVISGEQKQGLIKMGSKVNFTVEEPQTVEMIKEYLDSDQLTLEQVQETVAFKVASPAQKAEIIKHATQKGAASVPSPESANRSSTGTAPEAQTPRREAIATSRAEIAAQIAKIRRVPEEQRTPEQVRELIALTDQLRMSRLRSSGPLTHTTPTGGTR